MIDHFPMTDAFKAALLTGELGDMTKGVSFDQIKIRLHRDDDGCICKIEIQCCRKNLLLRHGFVAMNYGDTVTLQAGGDFSLRIEP